MYATAPLDPMPTLNRALDDERLVALAQEGDRTAFDELAARHSLRLRNVLVRISGDRDAADDAVQEALVRAWSKIERFEGRAQFSTWLVRIGINEAYRGLRRASEAPLALDDHVGERVPAWGRGPDEVFERREFLAAIDRAVGELPPDYRAAVTLRDVEGMSTAEAAEILGIGERALKSRLHRGRMALRGKLDQYFNQGYV